MKITSARITEMPKSMFDEMPKVVATFENGSEKELFSYYPDELSFTPDEFVGLTENEARQLKTSKDKEYLQSNMRSFKMVHISQIKTGDVIERDGKETTVCRHNIKRSEFMGITLFGDSYTLGLRPVKKFNY